MQMWFCRELYFCAGEVNPAAKRDWLIPTDGMGQCAEEKHALRSLFSSWLFPCARVVHHGCGLDCAVRLANANMGHTVSSVDKCSGESGIAAAP